MIIHRGVGRSASRHVLLFGSGLIGSAINLALRAQHRWQEEEIIWSWQDTDQRKTAASTLLSRIRKAERVDIIWAAGISGFGSTDSDMDRETGHVSEIADLAIALAAQTDRVSFHLFSSLGGLHEGQCLIDRKTMPKTRRPYGIGKLRQEDLVKRLGHGIVPRIYRPSSVYGVSSHGRLGLFTAVAKAMILQKTLTVYGSASTLRDYVYAQDIGTYVSGLITRDELLPMTDILASGKPTTVAEAIFAIETLFGRRLYCRYESAPHNSLDMTVRVSALPPALPRTALNVGIASVFQTVSRSLAR